jgi:putative transposase
MTYPRSHLIDPSGGTYHVCSRCVRRSFLCGVDELTGRDFSHRREWIENRLLELSQIFSISVYSYAVMSNHYHIVLTIEPTLLSDEEVAERWLKLCPVKTKVADIDQAHNFRKSLIMENDDRLAELRDRLQSLSWFMRFINEPLARLANKEDCCTGRFWEGRFKSQILLDDASVLACMVYVDLNPVRAGIAKSLKESDFTSIQRRIRNDEEADVITAIDKLSIRPFADIKLKDYVALVHWTAETQEDKRHGLPREVDLCLRNNHTNSDHWFRDHIPQPNCWQRAVGSIDSLKDYAKSIGQCWVKSRSVVHYN